MTSPPSSAEPPIVHGQRPSTGRAIGGRCRNRPPSRVVSVGPVGGTGRRGFGRDTGGQDVRYLLLIYDDESIVDRMAEAEQEADMGAWFAYDQELRTGGNVLAGEALQPTATATTIRRAGGQTLTT